MNGSSQIIPTVWHLFACGHTYRSPAEVHRTLHTHGIHQTENSEDENFQIVTASGTKSTPQLVRPIAVKQWTLIINVESGRGGIRIHAGQRNISSIANILSHVLNFPLPVTRL